MILQLFTLLTLEDNYEEALRAGSVRVVAGACIVRAGTLHRRPCLAHL